MSADDGGRRGHQPDPAPVDRLDPDAAAAVAAALRTLGDDLAGAVRDQLRADVPHGKPVAGSEVSGRDVSGYEVGGSDVVDDEFGFDFDDVFGVDGHSAALFGSLGVEAVIDTNAAVSQQSLREFLR